MDSGRETIKDKTLKTGMIMPPRTHLPPLRNGRLSVHHRRDNRDLGPRISSDQSTEDVRTGTGSYL
ncbi:MAG: hypothetical protein JOS17DRAFT_791085 [Linnemannia elongata]|nr:MAG: hypothetical protein JOS17DRAFT_791085 [Linnemannia elongata]